MTLKAKIYRFGYPFYKIYRIIFRPRNIGACCLIEYQEELLLVRNTYGDGLWNFPGGGVKKGEIPSDAAVREISEEVGIELKSVVGVGGFQFDANRYKDIIHAFSAVVPNKKFNIDPNEILEAKWFSENNMPLKDLSTVGKKVFEAFQKNKSKR